MTRLKVAAVGTGYFSQYHYDAWSRIAEVELVAIGFSKDEARARRIADRYRVKLVFQSLEEMLDTTRPDILDIISPPETHLDFARAAKQRGIHAISQKPMATSLAEGFRMAELSRAPGSLVVVHDNWRFKPWFREIRRLLDAGTVGRVLNALFRMRPGDGQGPRAYLDRQPYFQKMPRFLIHETGIHMVDTFRFLFGDVEAVTARLRKLNPAIAGEDSGYVVFDFTSGQAGLLDGNRLVDHEAPNTRLTLGEMLVEGETGQIRLHGNGDIEIRETGGTFRAHSYVWENRGYSGDCVHALQRHVVDHLLHGGALENRAEDYLPNMLIEEACYRSNAGGKTVRIGTVTAEDAAA